jgi:hypothetical protein
MCLHGSDAILLSLPVATRTLALNSSKREHVFAYHRAMPEFQALLYVKKCVA